MIVNYDRKTFIVQATDVNTFPRFKLMSFVYIICFSERIKRTRFLLGCMQPSSVMFTYYDFLTQLKIIGSGTIVW
jgi:hypothetical protein